jgi:hypothetical protein
MQDVLDFKFDYLVTYDLESIQKQTNEFVRADKKLKYIANHVAVLVSIASNIPGYTNTKFILSDNPDIFANKYLNISMS